jgi:hypothetical protein
MPTTGCTAFFHMLRNTLFTVTQIFTAARFTTAWRGVVVGSLSALRFSRNSPSFMECEI